MFPYLFILILSIIFSSAHAVSGGSDESAAAGGGLARSTSALKTATEEDFLAYLKGTNKRFLSSIGHSMADSTFDALWHNVKYLRNLKPRDLVKALARAPGLSHQFLSFIGIWSQAFTYDLRRLSGAKTGSIIISHTELMRTQASLDPYVYFMMSLTDIIIPKLIGVHSFPEASPIGIIRHSSLFIYHHINEHYFPICEDIPEVGLHRVFMHLPTDFMASHEQPSYIFNDGELVPNSGLWLSAREHEGKPFVRIQRHSGIDALAENQFTVLRTTMNIPHSSRLGSFLMSSLSPTGKIFVPFPLDHFEQLCLEAEFLDTLLLLSSESGEITELTGALSGHNSLTLSSAEDAESVGEPPSSSAKAGGVDSSSEILTLVAHLKTEEAKESILTALDAEAETYAARIQAEQLARQAAVTSGAIPGHIKAPKKKVTPKGAKAVSKVKGTSTLPSGESAEGYSSSASSSPSPLTEELNRLKAEIVGKGRLKFRKFAQMLASLYGNARVTVSSSGSHRTVHDPLGVLTYVKHHGSEDSTMPAFRATRLLDHAYEGLVAIINQSAE